MARLASVAAPLLTLCLCMAVARADDAHKLLMIPGPVEFSDPVLAAAGGLPLSHMDKGFAEEFGQTLEMLRKVFLTKTGQPFVIAGSGTLGWDIVAANLVESRDRVLVVNSGYFGDKFADSLDTFGMDVQEVRVDSLGQAPSLKKVEESLKAAKKEGKPYKLVTVTHVDTSTGVRMDVQAVARLVNKVSYGTMVVVDGVCSVGAEELRMDDWGIDFVLTASQKALGAPPGLSIVVASQRALKAVGRRTTNVASYYASLEKWLPIMQAYEARTPRYFATPPVQLVQALRVSLREILGDAATGTYAAAETAMDARFAAHVRTSNRVKDAVESWGLQLLTSSRDHEAHTLTAVRLPDGITAADLLPRIAARGVVVAGGLFPEISYFRIGHMHLSATIAEEAHIDKTLEAVRQALMESDYKGVASPEAVAELRESGWEPRTKLAATEADGDCEGKAAEAPAASAEATGTEPTSQEAADKHDEL